MNPPVPTIPAAMPSPDPMHVPPASEWDAMLVHVHAFLKASPRTPPLTLAELDETADALLQSAPVDRRYRKFLMVQLHNAIWQPVVASIPMGRRILMLPPCLRSHEECPATTDEYGLLCVRCGRCCLGPLSSEAETLGYAVLIVESTRLVQPFLDRGDADAVMGVGCMPALERSFQYLLNGAIPGLAIPLLRDGCRDTDVSVNHLLSILHQHTADGNGLPDYHSIRRKVDSWFEPDALLSLLPDAPGETELASLAWLGISGKRWRPFLAAATYAALTGCKPDAMPQSLRRIAVAVECLHKASLIFDDIQDDDPLRYGRETFHRQHGVPLATTAGLHLLGLGYHLIATCGAQEQTAATMTALISDAHLKLCRGQGAELWAVRHPRLIPPDEVLQIFRLKTSPAFSVGLRLGALLAGSRGLDETLQAFGDALGTAYQIQDDLEDYQPQDTAGDFSAGRPSYITALAAANSPPALRSRLEQGLRNNGPDAANLLRDAVAATGSLSLAQQHLEVFRQAAMQALRPLTNYNLKILLHRFLAQAVPPPHQP